MSRLEPGRIQAVDLGRQFRIATGGGRSLKATLLRRESPSIHEFWALRHVNVEIEPGETFGVVGRNGSGKSTFLKMLARIYGPSEGHCSVGGRMSSLIELGAGFHPEFNAIENVYLAGAVYGIPKRELERDIDEIIGFAELDAFAYQPIKTYSSGMFMRLGFSVAMHVRPDVLLLDEVLAVGDERFIQKCLARIAQFRREGGTMLLVTHDPGTVKRLCRRAMLIEKGSMVMVGSADEVLTESHDRLASQDHPLDHAEPRVRRGRSVLGSYHVDSESGGTRGNGNDRSSRRTRPRDRESVRPRHRIRRGRDENAIRIDRRSATAQRTVPSRRQRGGLRRRYRIAQSRGSGDALNLRSTQ